jgi:hypothetical protein
MKICSKCKKEKDINEFGFDKSRKDGRNLKCKKCRNQYAQKYYKYIPLTLEQKEKRREWERKYRKRPNANNAQKCREWYQRNLERARKLSLEATKRYLATEKGKKKRNNRTCEWEKKNPEKRRAQEKLQYWVRTGKIQKPHKCSKCEIECDVQGHHEDYTKPLDVIWLCARCHFLLHHEHKHHRERLNEKTAKADAKVRPLEETQGLTQK